MAVQAFETFEVGVVVHPKCAGLQRLVGLHGIDMASKTDTNFGVLGEFLVVAKEAEELV